MNIIDTAEQNPRLQMGQALARARVLREMTQEELGEQCGVTTRAIQNLEAGKNVSLALWLDVAAHVGYLQEIMRVMQMDRPVSMQQMHAIADRTFVRRKRVRK